MRNRARICVPVCVTNGWDLAQSVTRAAEAADFVELRLDCLTPGELHETKPDLVKLSKHADSAIYTLRPVEEGGQRALGTRERLAFWVPEIGRLLSREANFADLEIDVARFFIHARRYLPAVEWNRVICSFHDFTGIPAEIEKIYERMARTPAGILKIAVHANEITDCIPVLRLLERAAREGKQIIAIAMGEAGVLTRILGPARGAFLTYGSLDTEHATAPGQIAARQLRELYRIHMIDHETQITGIVGDPVSHSLSPRIHNAAYAATGQNAVYIPFAVRDLDNFMRRMVRPNTREIDWQLRGLSITAPHKRSVIDHLDWVDQAALEIGAVNTVVIEDQQLHGYNTDARASLEALRGLIELEGCRVGVLGAGGAARALLWSLREAGAHVTVFARRLERAREAAEQFGARYAVLEGASLGGFELVVNATPLGTHGDGESETPAVAKQLEGTRVAYDLVYNPSETRFMREAKVAGCQSVGGLEMLVLQAAEQFKLWMGINAPLEVMRKEVTGDR